MFVGHALFAFALGALAAWWLGLSRERAVQLGVVAGLFAANAAGVFAATIPSAIFALAFVALLVIDAAT